MKSITLEQVLLYNPCQPYNSVEKLSEYFGDNKSLTFAEIAKLNIPFEDKIWILTRDHFLPLDKAVLFTIFCAEQCIGVFESLYPNDKRPRNAIELAKAFVTSHEADLSQVNRIAKEASEASESAASVPASFAARAAWACSMIVREFSPKKRSGINWAYQASASSIRATPIYSEAEAKAQQDQLEYILDLIGVT
jgi:hypothetical protein